MSSLQLPLPAVRRLAAALLLMVPLGSPALAGEAEAPDPHLLALAAELGEAQPEAAIRESYEALEKAAERSGHDLDLHLSNFDTIGIGDFSRHRLLDLMTLSTGMRIIQARNYYQTPWLDGGKRVYYELYWEPTYPATETASARLRDHYRGLTLAQGLAEEREAGAFEEMPFAITTYQVRARLAGRSRTYRAAAFWFDTEDGTLEPQIQDTVVQGVGDPVEALSTVVTKEEYDDLGSTMPRPVPTGGPSPPDPCDP